MNKLITLTGVLTAGAIALAYGAGCGGDDDPATTNTPTNAVTNTAATNTVTNTAATNTATTNTAATNTAVTNTATTNTGTTNTATTNTATTNTGTTNVATNTGGGACMTGNYLDAGAIKGYCFGLQNVGGTETPSGDLTSLSFAYSLPGTSWDDIAMLGCNLNQGIEGGAGSEGTWTPTGTGICVNGSGFERIQIQGPTGATNANDRWCANTTGCAAWSEFNTQCWEGGNGTAYAQQPLAQVAALQPSKSDGVDVPVTPISGTICVSSIALQ